MTMREYLKENNEKLYAAYMQSVEIAMKEWLPAVSHKKGSYNSYPHIKNLEQYIDHILYLPENASYHNLSLTDVEVYVLLCSILLHDIGKATNADDHANESEKTIKKNWAELGIVSEQFGIIIAFICRFHDCNNRKALERVTNTVYIDLYGKIRARMLAVLLFLADHLDSTYTRVIPSYIEGRLEVVGEFRRKIQSVRIDFENKMVTTIIDVNHLRSEDNCGDENIDGDLYEYLQEKLKSYTGSVLQKSMLYNIASNVAENAHALRSVRNELYEMHMPLNEWFIECDDYLFRVLRAEKDDTKKDKFLLGYQDIGKLTTRNCIEPILTMDYLKFVLKGIFIIASGTFGESYHNYIELMNFTCETPKSLSKIKCAVKRLSLLFEGDSSCKIFCDNVVWSITSDIAIDAAKSIQGINDELNKLYKDLEERCTDIHEEYKRNI